MINYSNRVMVTDWLEQSGYGNRLVRAVG